MNNLDKQYLDLCQDILQNGVRKETRNGVTYSVFGRTIRHSMKTGFPILTTKKVSIKNIVTELLWFISGETNTEYLVKNGCNIWVGDCYKAYLKDCNTIVDPSYYMDILVDDPFENKIRPFTEIEFTNRLKEDSEFCSRYGDIGPGYGKQWTGWVSMNKRFDDPFSTTYFDWSEIDQLSMLINDLKTNPDSRRLIVSAWNVADLPDMLLPPCHLMFQCYTRELTLDERIKLAYKSIEKNDSKNYIELLKIIVDTIDVDLFDFYFGHIPKRELSLLWTQRSVDFPLGGPFNIASYAILLMLLAKECNMTTGDLIGNFGDTHIYENQIEGINEQLTRDPFDLPTLNINYKDSIFDYEISDFKLEDYKSHSSIKMPVSN